MPKGRPLSDRLLEAVEFDTNGGCWLWTRSLKTGYGHLSVVGRKRTVRAHRASWLAFRGPVPSGLCVLHRCDIRECINPDHLFLGTVADNNADKEAKGRGNQPTGERNNKAKITWPDVEEIRRLRAEGVYLKDLSARYGLTTATISKIARQETWK